jgi:hypothetical protein
MVELGIHLRRMAGHMNHVVGGGGVGLSILGAIDANTVQVWLGAIVAAAGVLWGLFREQKRKDFDDSERRRMMASLVEANVRAVEAGKLPPFPEVLELVTGMAGTVKQKPTAS